MISSEVIYPGLIKKMNQLTDLLENRVNENIIDSDMAWFLLEKNLEIAIKPKDEKEVVAALANIDDFIQTLN